MSSNYICAVDIGSSKIASCVAEIKNRRICGAHFYSAPSKGITRGVITDSIALIGSLGKLLKNLKSKSGVNIKSICVNVSSPEIITKHSHAVIPLIERGSKVITLSDIQRVNGQAKILAASLEEEVIHQIPFSYTIDSRSNILNPLGLYSHRLEVDLYLVSVKLSSIQNIARVVNQAGYDIKSLSLSGLAASNIVFAKEPQPGTNVLCDIGSDVTELIIFKDGTLVDVVIMPLGGNDITLGLSDKLNISFELAEDTKRTYGKVGDYVRIEEGKEILIKKGQDYKPLPQRLVCELITSQAKSICQNIKENLEKKINTGKIDNFISVGRTVLLEGFLETLENTLEVQVQIGRISEPEIASLVNLDHNLSGQKYLNYITALGLLYEAFKAEYRQNSPLSKAAIGNPLLKVINRVKEVYEEYF